MGSRTSELYIIPYFFLKNMKKYREVSSLSASNLSTLCDRYIAFIFYVFEIFSILKWKKTIHLELIYMTVKLCKTHHFIKIFSSISSIMFISFLSFIDFALQSTEVWNNLSIVNTRCWSLWFNYPLGSRSRHVSFPE